MGPGLAVLVALVAIGVVLFIAVRSMGSGGHGHDSGGHGGSDGGGGHGGGDGGGGGGDGGG
jgi:hypothetical protein